MREELRDDLLVRVFLEVVACVWKPKHARIREVAKPEVVEVFWEEGDVLHRPGDHRRLVL